MTSKILKSKEHYYRKLKGLKLRTPIHPFLFAVFPILFLYDHNIQEVILTVLPVPLLFLLVSTAVFLLLLNIVIKDMAKTSLIATLYLILVFSYGHIHSLIANFEIELGSFVLGQDKLLYSMWTPILIFGTYYIVKKITNTKPIESFLTVAGIILIATSLFGIGTYEIKNDRIKKLLFPSNLSFDTKKINLSDEENLPDIYYFIFDRYTNFDIIENYYEYDISGFSNYLDEKGFYVTTNTHSNYPATFLSLGSSLNMEYLNYLSKELGEDSTDRSVVRSKIQDNEVQNILKTAGYKYVNIGSWYQPTRTNKNADLNLTYNPLQLTFINLDEFSTRLFETTMFTPILLKVTQSGPDGIFARDDHRNRILFQFQKLEELNDFYSESPKFVFAHILSPHGPYVLDQNCEAITLEEVKEERLENYLNQLTCTNSKLESLIDKILSYSKNSIIVLQADEGPAPIKYNLSENWAKSDSRALEEKFGILNAYYFPDKKYDLLYQSITPVNTFRLIFDQYFGTDYGFLEDRVYVWENPDKPYKFHDITKKIRGE